ncbi:MAG: flagellar export protein FliJ [Nitrospirae bacterium]|nr:flagellar export protein FliJ [Nitrospirota bacterium]
MSKNRTITKILKLKDNRKTEAELEVKKASDRADEERTKLQSLEDDYLKTIRYFREKQEEGAMDINNLISCYDFFSRINGKITEQKKVHTLCQDELACRKDDLVIAHKEKKVFEILKDKAVKKEHRERLDVEQKENDFFALSRRPR